MDRRAYWQQEQLDGALQDAGFRVVARWCDDAPQERWLCRIARK
jgi:hypothetical protein